MSHYGHLNACIAVGLWGGFWHMLPSGRRWIDVCERGIRVRLRRGSLRDGYHIQGRQQARKLPNPDTGR